MLKDLARVRVRIAHAIKASITKLEEYLAISRKTKMYTLAMGKHTLSKILYSYIYYLFHRCAVINPKIKFGWLRKHWTTTEFTTAQESVKAAVSTDSYRLFSIPVLFIDSFAFQLLEYARIEPKEVQEPPQPSRKLVKSFSMSREAQAQASGYAHLQSIHGTIQRSLSEATIDPAVTTSSASSEEQARQTEAALIERVDEELKKYEAAGLYPETAPVDLVRFWQVSTPFYYYYWKYV